MHDLLIVVHAVAGTTAFVLGVAVLAALRNGDCPPLFRSYYVSVSVMAATLTAAVGIDWNNLATGTQLVFASLCGLALYVVSRAERARRRMPLASAGDRHGLVDDVGFTLVALLDGFVIVTAVNLSAPPWAVGVLALLVILAGHRAISSVSRAIPV